MLVRIQRLLPRLALVGLFLVIFSLSFSRAIRAGTNHDEHQFIASAVLFSEQGQLPYRDYAYFHFPNLIFVYGLIFQFTSYKLLAARLFSALCITGIAGLLYLFSLDVFRNISSTAGHWVGASAALLFVASPLVAFTGSFAWNHNLALFLAVLAFKLYWPGVKRQRSDCWLFLSGLCLGLAVGTRLSFASTLAPFAAGLVFYQGGNKARGFLKLLSLFGAGLFVSLLPTLLLFAVSPEQFIFGNFTYARLNTLYREETGFFGPPNPMTAVEKLAYFWDFVLPQPANLLSFAGLLFLGYTPLVVELWQRRGRSFEAVFMLLLVPLVSLGALWPTPAWYQYYAAPLPFAILTLVYGLGVLVRRHPPGRTWLITLFLQLVVLANLYQLGDYRRISFLLYPEAWRPVMMHNLGVRLAELGAAAEVLTLAPIYPLEGGASIYPEFATGPFAWRTAPLVEPARRAELDLVSDLELEQFLEGNPPGAILVGFEGELDQALNDYALQHGYRWMELGRENWMELDREIWLWLPPELTHP